jgi:FtsP/CotA-like multicopper oxidase with cupredoxin domain
MTRIRDSHDVLSGANRLLLTVAVTLVAMQAGDRPTFAQNAQRIVTPPPAAQIVRTRPAVTLGGALVAPVISGRDAFLDLKIDYTDATIYNPDTDKDDPVRLRSYRDVRATAPPKIPFVAPTIEISPGETVRITLHNKLKPDDANTCPGPDINTPHCFNRTNLHAHGLWVSPTGNSDNVLVSINPGVEFQYEYNVPADHPAGTFWYHTHLHGSTALQVSSGMAGFLIVRGDRLPTIDTNGDVDTLLKDDTGAAFTPRPVLLQQIQYACRGTDGKIQKDGNGKYFCNPGQVGGIEGYDQFGPGTWPKSGRYTTINGEVIPVFPGAQVGRIERWRIAHAGVRDTVLLQFKKMRDDAPRFAGLTAAQQENWIAQNCPGDPLPEFALATDGLTRGQIVQRTTTVLQPGYREDLLMVFPEAGNYCVIDDNANESTTVNQQTKSRKFLGSVNVGIGQPVGPDLKAYLQAQLVAAADRTMPSGPIRQKVLADLASDLRLTSFVPHPDIADSEVTGKQDLEFAIVLPPPALKFEVDNQPYKPDRIDRTLKLGGVDEWTLTANATANHPFHIHVNPFQVVNILNAQGQDVSVNGEPNDPQYANLKGVWKDTLLVKSNYHVVVRTRYQRYIGEFVLHCHILDHEDQGMMQNVRIAIPDGAGGLIAPHPH